MGWDGMEWNDMAWERMGRADWHGESVGFSHESVLYALNAAAAEPGQKSSE